MNDLSSYLPIAQAIAALLHPHGEVVLHDLESGRIAAIYNNFSKRKVGDESLLEELGNDAEWPDFFPPYSKINWDGRRMRSSTATIRDKMGKPVALLCMNLDLSQWEECHQFLGEWLSCQQEQPELLFQQDWRKKINQYVSRYLKKEGLALRGLSAQKKRELVQLLHREGAFSAKHAASYVAEVLDLSRATVYNYLRV